MTTKIIERPHEATSSPIKISGGSSTSALSNVGDPVSAPVEPAQKRPRATFLDVEIRTEIAPPYTWERCWQTGMAVAVTWDDKEGFKDWFAGESEDLLLYLASFDRVVGFNTLAFDYRVIDGDLALIRKVARTLHPADSPQDIPRWVEEALAGKTVDMLADVYEWLGFRVKLELITGPTLGRKKTMNGILAPVEWGKRNRHQVIGYCRNDVELERDLYFYGFKHGRISYIDGRGSRNVVPISWRTR